MLTLESVSLEELFPFPAYLVAAWVMESCPPAHSYPSASRADGRTDARVMSDIANLVSAGVGETAPKL